MKTKAIARSWLVVVIAGAGLLLTLTLASGEAPSSIGAALVPKTILRATTVLTPAYEADAWVSLGGPPVSYTHLTLPTN